MTGLKYGQTAVSKEQNLPGRKDFDPQCSNIMLQTQRHVVERLSIEVSHQFVSERKIFCVH